MRKNTPPSIFKKYPILLVGVFLIVMAVPKESKAVGIGAKPAELNVTITGDGVQTQTLIVFNLSEKEMNVIPKAEPALEGIRFTPEKIILAPQEHKNIEIKVSGTVKKSQVVQVLLKGNFETSENSDAISQSPGLQIPLTINITKKTRDDALLYVTAAGFAGSFAGLALVKKIRTP